MMLNTVTALPELALEESDTVLSQFPFSGGSTLVVFDQRVQDIHTLRQALVPAAIAYTVKPHEDALMVIAHLLSTTGATRLAIVAHGEPGVVHIGVNPLNLEALQRRSCLLQAWNVEEIALYSCEVAQDDRLIAELERLTGARVAGAIGKVGAADFGGSWELKPALTDSVFDLEAVANYSHTLAITFNSTSATSATDTSINATEVQNLTISLAMGAFGNKGRDVLVGMYGGSNGTTLVYWAVLDLANNNSTPTVTFPNPKTNLGSRI